MDLAEWDHASRYRVRSPVWELLIVERFNLCIMWTPQSKLFECFIVLSDPQNSQITLDFTVNQINMFFFSWNYCWHNWLSLREASLTMGGGGYKIGQNLPHIFCDPPHPRWLKFCDPPPYKVVEFLWSPHLTKNTISRNIVQFSMWTHRFSTFQFGTH